MKKKKTIERTARSVKRYLKRHGEEKLEETEWIDNFGNVHESKIAARVSSFINILVGGFTSGFPAVLPKLFYPAWTFYPFIFFRKGYAFENIYATIAHERIHARQGFDIHLTISLPILFFVFVSEILFNLTTLQVVGVLLCVPFIPTILYVFEFFRTMRIMILAKERDTLLPEITMGSIRENTCFEREAISKCMNEEYLRKRKIWSVLAYTGWKRFKNYGL